MKAHATFTVTDWTPATPAEAVGDQALVQTPATPGFSYMNKWFEGDLEGRSTTFFVGCLNADGAGSYAAIEAVEGTLSGRQGSFNLVHAASTHGSDRYDEHLRIVPGSGGGDLEGISGHGTITIDADGTHHLELEYELDA